SEARQDAFDVAVEHRYWFAECNAGDSACGIASDPRQRLPLVCCCWKAAGTIICDDARGFVEVARTAVIAESLPRFQDGIFWSCCKFVDVRELFNKTENVGRALVHAGLLQHHFREPDHVQISCVAPGQFALFACIPGEEGAAYPPF